jgi:hypothetical protein
MAQLIITVPDPEVPRVQAAMGSLLSLVDQDDNPRGATAEEVRQYLVDMLIGRVTKEEQRVAGATAANAVAPITAT